MADWDVVQTGEQPKEDPWSVVSKDPWTVKEVAGQKTMLQKAAGATGMPMRGLRGIGVGTEHLIEGDPLQTSLERATEATKEGFQPQKGEKLGSFAGESLDPRFLLFGGMGEKMAVSGLGKAVMGGAAALGGTQAVEETAEKGAPTLKGTGSQTAFGALGGATLYPIAKALGPVFERAGRILKSLIGQSDPISFGKVVQSGESIVNHMAEGKTLQQVASEMGITPETARKAVDTFDKAKPHVVETSLLPTIDQAIQGDQPSMLKVLQKSLANFYSHPTEASTTAANLFKRRYSEIALGRFESHLFARDTLKGLSDVERQAIPFILEEKLPEADKFVHPQKDKILQTAQGYLDNPSSNPNLKTAVDKIGAYLDEGHAFLKEYYDDIGFRENYINHIWDKPPEIRSGGPGKASLSQYNPFSKKRFIASYADGINQGLTPKTLDTMKLLDVYDNYKIKSIANAKFVDALKAQKVEGGFPAIMSAEKAPSDWVYIDNPALNRKRLIPGKEGQPGLFVTQPVKVSPEVAPAVKAILERPFSSVNPGPHAAMLDKAMYHGINAYEYMNAVTKKLKLSLSFFHHVSLTETGMLAGDIGTPFRAAWDMGKMLLKDSGMNPGELYKAFSEGKAAYANIPLAKDALDHGLILHVGDTQSGRIQQLIAKAETSLKGIPGLQKMVKSIGTFNDVWDKSLFEYYAGGMKLDLYERNVAKNIEKFGDKIPIEKIKRETADFINKAEGSFWESWMVDPRAKQALQWTFLAPQWTTGRLATFGTIFKGGVQGSMGRRFWARAAFTYATLIGAWNYHNTMRDGLKGPNGQPGRMPWQNEPGKRLHLYMDKADDGRNNYVLPAKGISEVFGWVYEPWQTFGRKLAPLLQFTVEQVTGFQPGMGGYKLTDQDKTLGGYLRRYEAPISTQKGRNVFLTFPTSKGISKTQVIEMMQRGYETSDMDKVGAAMGWAVENGFDAKTLQQIAYRNYKQQLKKALLK